MTGTNLFKGDVMDVDEVARDGFEGWNAGKVVVVPGFSNRRGTLVVRLAPRSLVRRIVKRLNSPQSRSPTLRSAATAMDVRLFHITTHDGIRGRARERRETTGPRPSHAKASSIVRTRHQVEATAARHFARPHGTGAARDRSATR